MQTLHITRSEVWRIDRNRAYPARWVISRRPRTEVDPWLFETIAISHSLMALMAPHQIHSSRMLSGPWVISGYRANNTRRITYSLMPTVKYRLKQNSIETHESFFLVDDILLSTWSVEWPFMNLTSKSIRPRQSQKGSREGKEELTSSPKVIMWSYKTKTDAATAIQRNESWFARLIIRALTYWRCM